MLWYFIVFLGFFFGLVKFSEPKFTISDTIFFNWLFVCFLNAQFKTNNNLPPKIDFENIVNVTLLCRLESTIAKNKSIVKFCYVARLTF